MCVLYRIILQRRGWHRTRARQNKGTNRVKKNFTTRSSKFLDSSSFSGFKGGNMVRITVTDT